MSHLKPQHPHAAALSAFALGQLPERELEHVAQHLEACDTCVQTLETTRSDRFVDLVRSIDFPLKHTPPARLHAGYELFGPIGQGGMGVVYKARQSGLGRIVAFKRMRSPELVSAEDLSRFRVEAEVMARLAHPNIVQVFEVGEQDGSPFLACEFVAGAGLDTFLRGTPLPPRVAAQLVATLARAIHLAHQHSIVHRDLKPSNVLLTWPGAPLLPDQDNDFWPLVVPKIADFGLAKRLDSAEQQTRTNALLGTPEYMAPEQADGKIALVGPATDIHALGAILYESISGRRPFQGTDVGDTLRLVRDSVPTSPRRLQPKLPRDLNIICLKCLEKVPARRYVSAAALAEDLEAWLGGRPITAQAPSAWERSCKWTRRNVARATAIALGLTLALGAILGTAIHVWRLQQEVARANAAESRALDSARHGYEAVDRLIQQWSLGAQPTAAWRARDVQLKDKALVFLYGAVDDVDAASPGGQLTRGMLLTYAGSVQQTLARYELARIDLLRAADLLQALCDDRQLGADARNHQANCRYNLGVALTGLNQSDEAVVELEKSLSLLPTVTVASEDAVLLSRVAMRHESIGNARTSHSQPKLALDAYRKSHELRRRILALMPDDLTNQLRFAESCRMLAITAALMREFAAAENAIHEGEAVLRSSTDWEQTPEITKGRARLAAGLASVWIAQDALEPFLKSQDHSIELMESVHAVQHDDLDAQTWLHVLHRAKAYTLCRHDRFAAALPHWKQAIAFCEGSEQTYCRVEFALERARIGQHRQATDEIVEIVVAPDLPSRTYLHAARVYSRAADAARRDAELDEALRASTSADYTQAGFDCLKQSVVTAARQGAPQAVLFSDVDIDPDLAAVRAMDGYPAWRAAQ